MTTERDPGTRIVLSWLREDAHENAERVLLLALDEVDTTQQRRSGWPAWRTLPMNPMYKLGLAAAAVLVVVVLGYNVLPRPITPGQPGASPTIAPPATQVPTVAPATPARSGPWLLTQGPLVPGTYFANPFPAPEDALRIEFTVPEGWYGAPPNAVNPDVGTSAPGGAAVVALRPKELFLDPCQGNALGSPTLSAGETVDELVNALVEISSGRERPYLATTPEETEVSGYPGQRLDLFLPSDVDFATCDEGNFWVWDVGPYAQGVGNRWHVWILDVDGTRTVILAEDFAATSAVHQAELQAIVDSLKITP